VSVLYKPQTNRKGRKNLEQHLAEDDRDTEKALRSRSCGNRGMGTQHLAEQAAQQMAEAGIALLVHVPTEVMVHRKGPPGQTQITGAHYGKRAVADFIGVKDGKAVVVEVKSTQDKRLRLLAARSCTEPTDLLPVHQREFLDASLKHGARVYLLVMFVSRCSGPLLASRDVPLWYLIPWSFARGLDVIDQESEDVRDCAAGFLFLEDDPR